MMTQPLFITFLILVCTLAFIIQGKFRADFIALIGLVVLGLTRILSMEELLAGFANPVVIILAALFVVSAGIFNSGLVDEVGNYLLRFGVGTESKLLFIVMLTGGLLSAFLSGTGIVVILIPIVMSMALKKKMSPSRYLLPLAYASSLGAVLTLIGTAPNIYISNILQNQGIVTLSFFDFTPIGLVAFGAGVLFMLTFGRILLPHESVVAKNSVKGLSPGELAGMYKVYDRLHYLHIPASSDIVGERLIDLQLPIHYEITLIEIKRKVKEKQLSLLPKQMVLSAKADEVLHPDDIILVFGEEENVERLTGDYELEYKHFNPEQIRKYFVSSKFGLTEILIMPHSIYENQTLVNVHFREKYRCNVLAINRNGEYIQTDVGTERLKPGDALLIHGEWESIERISADLEDVIVIGSASNETEVVQTQEQFKSKAPIAAFITALMIVLLSIETIPAVLSVVTAALLMVITGCVRSMEEAYQKINWEPVLLIAAMLGIMRALENAGGVRLISDSLALFFENTGPYGLLAGFYLLTMILSPFIPYGVVAVVMAPIALLCSESLGVSPIPILIGIAISASLALSSPKATSSNTLVMTAGEYRPKDFALLGLSLQVFVGVVLVMTIPLFFSF
jgi:di/tricarboxylate transporter